MPDVARPHDEFHPPARASTHPPRWRTYAIAIGLALAAGLLRDWLHPVLGTRAPFALHLVAVMLAAWTMGFEGGVACTVAATLMAEASSRYGTGAVAWESPAGLATLGLVASLGLVTSWLTARWRGAEDELRRSHAALRQRAEWLELQVAARAEAEAAASTAQEALRASERTLTALMDASSESIWMLDRERVLVANRTAARRLGMTVAQLRGREWRSIFPADVIERRAQMVERVFGTGQPVRFEDTRNGIRFDHSFYPALGADGAVAAVAAFSRDVTGQRQREETLREMSQRLDYHVKHSPLAVIEFGPDMRITRWTGAAERLFGWTASEVLGRRHTDFPWLREGDEAWVGASDRAAHDARQFATRSYRKDGSIIHCEWYTSTLRDDSGTPRSTLSLILDVTEKNRLEQELRNQAQQLTSANRLKDDFLATLSHELRTPINAILGWAQILSMTPPSPERLQRGLDTIARNARLQARMVEDLLDISRIVAGSVRLDIQDVDVQTLVEHTLDAVRPGADARQLSLSSRVQPGLTAQADATRLQQVLWNLLSNAVKFTPAGGTVTLDASADAGHVVIEVRDTGIGITPSFLPHVFDRFRQADSSPTRQHGGLGLGLAIVRHIVELHGGTVAASSGGSGCGATITARIPARATSAARIQEPAPGAETTSLRLLDGVRVRVVNDEPEVRQVG